MRTSGKEEHFEIEENVDNAVEEETQEGTVDSQDNTADPEQLKDSTIAKEEQQQDDADIEKRKHDVTLVFSNLLSRDPTDKEMQTAYDVYMKNDWNLKSVETHVKFLEEYQRKTAIDSVATSPELGKGGGGGGGVFPTGFVSGLVNRVGEHAARSMSRVMPPASAPALNEETELWLHRSETSQEKLADKNKLSRQLRDYKDIIRVFEKVLQRLPSNDELDMYQNEMEKDTSFDSDKLKKRLIRSSEYKQLQSLQTNKVDAELPGNVTDAQLNLNITTIYQSVYPDLHPNGEFMEFLKEKYIDYQLNDQKLKQLLLLLKDLDAQPHVYHGKHAAARTGWMSGSEGIAMVDPTAKDLDQLLKAIREKKLSSCIASSKQVANEPIFYDVEACNNLMHAQGKKQYELSEYIERRNKDELGSVCARNYFHIKNDSKLAYQG
jgi:hypothetical protein